ncbi:MAG: HAMP domain-containing sensor histidine kinase [Acidobacteriota bacterium]
MRTTLMVSLLAVSLGLTVTCLLIIRFSVQREIRKNLNSDLSHSLVTFRNTAALRNSMLAREAALLADLPSLKALMATADTHTIQDGSGLFWSTSGADFLALTNPSGALYTYSNRGPALGSQLVAQGLQSCMSSGEAVCLVPLGSNLYELSVQPLYFGPRSNDSQLGFVIIGYAIDHQVTQQVSEVAAADVAFLIDGNVAVTTLPASRLADLQLPATTRANITSEPGPITLGRETYMAAAATLPSTGGHVELIVLKSYDRASLYLRNVNRWILALGISALFIAAMLAASISRTVTRPIESLVAGTRALGQGDFSYRFSTRGAVEVRELGQSFDRMRSELKATQNELLEIDRLATIGRMAGSISHDLRHHLSAIYANAEFMSLGPTGPEERVELLQEVKEAVQGMTDLIESLLLFSQTRHFLHLQRESLAVLVERTIHSVRQHPECRDVRITASQLDPIEATVDGSKLGRAVYNLIINACQATRGCASPAVNISLTQDSERIRVAISDTGKGIPASIRDTLFQPFVSSGKVNGIGLGLTIAQHVAQEHGGETRLERSEPGNTTFSILLYKKALAQLSTAESSFNSHAVDAALNELQQEEPQ